MISITKHGEGWTLGSEIYFGEGVAPEGYTHLCTAKGPQMRYGEDPSLRVEFPGEYDIHGIGIVCREAQGLLHYIIRIEDERYALIQDPAALETQETEPVNFRLCTTQASKDAVESMELE
jgi:hypothetical protein